MSRLLLPLYSLLMAVLLALTAPWWLWQMARTGKYREGLLERLGRVPSRLARPAVTARPASIWVHAVSVGEVLAASQLIAELGLALPGSLVYISTTTRTGQTLARERFGADRVFYFPLDFAFAMRAWLRFLRPALVVLVESEFWPRMLVTCQQANVPVAVVNARVSDRSWMRYRSLRLLWRPLLGSLALALAQSEEDARRLRWLGAARANFAGNLKYDIRAATPAAATAELKARLPDGATVVVCGSTLAGEEELLLGALPLDEIVTVLAPRHPERFDGVERLLAAHKLPLIRRSSWGKSLGRGDEMEPLGEQHGSLTPGTVVLLDSVGELASVYSLATLAVIGGGFLWPGGHNPLEAAQFGVPVLMGAQFANFHDVVDALMQEQAVILSDPAQLPSTLESVLRDREWQRAIGERGRRVFEQRAGATERTVAALQALLSGSDQPAVDEARPTGLTVGEGEDGKVAR